jgi:hypothetical protein
MTPDLYGPYNEEKLDLQDVLEDCGGVITPSKMRQHYVHSEAASDKQSTKLVLLVQSVEGATATRMKLLQHDGNVVESPQSVKGGFESITHGVCVQSTMAGAEHVKLCSHPDKSEYSHQPGKCFRVEDGSSVMDVQCEESCNQLGWLMDTTPAKLGSTMYNNLEANESAQDQYRSDGDMHVKDPKTGWRERRPRVSMQVGKNGLRERRPNACVWKPIKQEWISRWVTET